MRLKYHLIMGALKLLAALPFPVLYLLSDFLYLFLYYIPGYRKKVVMENLRFAFPEKTEEERNTIAKQFYANLADMIVETIKLIHADWNDVAERAYGDFIPQQQVYEKGKNVLMGLSHQFNWEMGSWALTKGTKFQMLAFYTPITDPVIEKIVLDYRKKLGTIFISTRLAWQEMEKYKDIPTLTAFLADQNPTKLNKAYWTTFLNRETPFHTGLERAALRTGDPVIFTEIVRVKRGYFKERSTMAFENPKETKPGEITEAFVRFLEESIKRQPDNWVWTHKRWKHKRIDY